MTKIRPGSVVVGVDGSRESDVAVAWAVRYAASFDRPLVLLNADRGLDAGDVFKPSAEVRHERRILARRAVDAALASALRLGPGLQISTLTSPKEPCEALVDLSDQASVVVVGTRGRGPVTSLLLGSVSVAVATHARCAVAVVRSQDRPVDAVLVGVSADGSDQVALQFAAELASVRGCRLNALHAFSPSSMLVDPASHGQQLEVTRRHERALGEALCGLSEKYPDLRVSRQLVDNSPVGALVRGSRAAECVVVGSRGRTSTLSLVGSVSRAVVEHASSSVVVVRS
jgi:nucleotide-binding universal stress UspA family protein